MLNTDAFVVLAGNPTPWDDETRSRCRGVPGAYHSEDLCKVQVEQHRRGRRSAELVSTIYGWSVRMASNLDSRSILYRRCATREEAIEKGIAWANEDPANREFFAHQKDLES